MSYIDSSWRKTTRHGSWRTTHGGKRHVMVPGGQLMAENDTSWTGLTTCIRTLVLNPKTNWRIDRRGEWNSEKATGERCGRFD
jgi:hypothetical protein